MQDLCAFLTTLSYEYIQHGPSAPLKPFSVLYFFFIYIYAKIKGNFYSFIFHYFLRREIAPKELLADFPGQNYLKSDIRKEIVFDELYVN
jgi:hypothetical protein